MKQSPKKSKIFQSFQQSPRKANTCILRNVPFDSKHHPNKSSDTKDTDGCLKLFYMQRKLSIQWLSDKQVSVPRQQSSYERNAKFSRKIRNSQVYQKYKQRPKGILCNFLKFQSKLYFAQVINSTLSLSDPVIKEKLIYCINFQQVQCQLEMKNQYMKLTIRQRPVTFFLNHQNKNELKEWYMAIMYHIQKEAHRQSMPQILIRPKFWKNHIISKREFEVLGESLDLLIFQSKHIGAQLQRVFTNSEFDHVAMVLKSSDNKIFVFESNSENGVVVWQWNTLQNAIIMKNCDRIVYRKIIFERTNEIMEQFQNFVKNSIGNKFKLNISKLLKKKSIFNLLSVSENRTYFCSELVAAALKNVKLLPQELSSTQYWPKDFSQASQLKLLQNAYISHEMDIDLEI